MPRLPTTASDLLSSGGPTNGLAANLLLGAGAVLMIGSGVIHVHLWDTGYRHIPTIGPLFLMQGIAAIVLAVVLAVFRRTWSALVAFAFVAATIGGFVISVSAGLFGFKDTWSAPFAAMAFGVEIAALVAIAAGSALGVLRPGSRPGSGWERPIGTTAAGS